nr:hypothetical protein [Ralstonia solanacearum]
MTQRMYDIKRVPGAREAEQPSGQGMGPAIMGRRMRGRRLEMECPGNATGVETKPIAHRVGTITYISGGIGQDDVAAMHAAAAEYNLQLTFSGKAGEYLADVDTSIRRADGTAVLGLVSDGPLLFVHLPPGRYQVSATYNGVKQGFALSVPRKGSVARSMVWQE